MTKEKIGKGREGGLGGGTSSGSHLATPEEFGALRVAAQGGLGSPRTVFVLWDPRPAFIQQMENEIFPGAEQGNPIPVTSQ